MPQTKQPRTVPEVLDALSRGLEEGRPWTPVAGGEDALARRSPPPERALLLAEVKALEAISENEGDVGLGSLVAARHLRALADCATLLPGLVGALERSDAVTLGECALRGDSDDPLREHLIEHGAEWTLIGPQGMRSVPVDALPAVLEADEIPLRLSVPRPSSPSGSLP